MAQPKLFRKLFIGFGCIHRGKIGTLDVLDQGKFKALLFTDLTDNCRDRLEPGENRRTQAAFPGDEGVVVPARIPRDYNWLENTMFAD